MWPGSQMGVEGLTLHASVRESDWCPRILPLLVRIIEAPSDLSTANPASQLEIPADRTKLRVTDLRPKWSLWRTMNAS